MAHFAQIDENNIVVQVIVVNNSCCIDENEQESEEQGIAFCRSLFGEESNWVQTSYNNNFRTRFAGKEFKYDSNRNAFITPKPYESWILDEQTLEWVAPVEVPSSEPGWQWDEENQKWEPLVCEIPEQPE